jgi:uncharacterized protein
MPLDYFAPGVYVEEVDRGSRPIEGISMSVAGFVGFTEDIRGGAELFKPMLITSWNQYLEYFGKQGSDGFTDFDAYLPFSVYGWFLNGGGRCWVTSIGTSLPGVTVNKVEKTYVKTVGKRDTFALQLKPSSTTLPNGQRALPQKSSANSSLALLDDEPEARVSVEISVSCPKPAPKKGDDITRIDNGEYFSVTVRQGEEILEGPYDHLSMDPAVQPEVGTYVTTALKDSSFVDVEILMETGQPLAKRPVNGVYELAPPDSSTAEAESFNHNLTGSRDDRSGIQGIFEIDDISMIACPDIMRIYQSNLINEDQMHGIMDTLITLCEGSFPQASYRMAVLDTPPDKTKPQHIRQWLNDFGRRSQYAALYYPWIKVPHPRRKGKPIAIPPSGYMMGMWCRTDETRGIHKAPANDTPKGVISLAYDVNFREQELLNPLGVNCIRKFPQRGIKVWGARTLVEPDNVQWRYISVRRLVSYIERCIELGTQWAVFEPNDEDLWARVTRTISNFLERLWREGALFGSNPKEAFYVKCDRSLNTPETVMLGRLYIEVGVSPVRPAEFIIIRLSQDVNSES